MSRVASRLPSRGRSSAIKGIAVFTRDNWTCQWCGDKADPTDGLMLRRRLGHVRFTKTATPITVDHIVPLVLGGANAQENLMALCKECNNEKGAYPFREPPRPVRRYAPKAAS